MNTPLLFGSIEWLHLVWIVPALGLVYLWGFHRRTVALAVFARTELHRHLAASVDRRRQYIRAALVLAAVFLVGISIARPQWGTEVEEISRRGVDLVVLLDVSRSMLAEDVRPSRIERARIDLKEMLDALQGDRIGLVAFAGRAEIRCPLTFDYGFFAHILDELEVGSVALGGTSIASAIHRGLECFQDEFPNHKAMLLITDGEDHEAFVEAAAEKARERNVRIFTVGIGDEREGRRIPIADESGNRTFLRDKDGNEVWTKLDATLLRRAAQITRGAYINLGRSAATLISLYENHVSALEKRELEGMREERYRDRYQWFLGLGLLLLAIEPLVSTRKDSTRKDSMRKDSMRNVSRRRSATMKASKGSSRSI